LQIEWLLVGMFLISLAISQSLGGDRITHHPPPRLQMVWTLDWISYYKRVDVKLILVDYESMYVPN
jgi:hypothetical protein